MPCTILLAGTTLTLREHRGQRQQRMWGGGCRWKAEGGDANRGLLEDLGITSRTDPDFTQLLNRIPSKKVCKDHPVSVIKITSATLLCYTHF